MKSDLKTRYSRMDDEYLLTVVHSQSSYRPDARELARQILRGRRLTDEVIDHWRDPEAEFAVPPWSAGKSARQLQRMSKRRRLLARVSFYLLLAIAVYQFGGAALAVLSGVKPLSNSELSGWLLWFVFFTSSCGLFLFLVYARALLQIVFWRKPVRVLLLRPFTYPESRKRTRRFARRYLRYLGHTYTISDTEVRPRWAFFESLQVIIPLIPVFWLSLAIMPDAGAWDVKDIMGAFLLTALTTGWLFPLFRSSFEVNSDEAIPRLKDFIGRRRARNVAWALSWDKLFKVSCAAETWQHTVRHLINSAQVVVVDLSHTGDGLKWELAELSFYGYLDRAVVVAHWSSAVTARSFLGTCGLFGRGVELFVYGDDGRAVKHEELTAALISAAARPGLPAFVHLSEQEVCGAGTLRS